MPLTSFRGSAAAVPKEPIEQDRYELVAHGETHAQMFRRALLPGPEGALVVSRRLVPLDQYVMVQARRFDSPWQPDSIDFEVSAWGRSWLGEREPDRRFDGDVQTASVELRQSPFSLRLGRQVVAGGAARYTRLDGLELEAELGSGFQAQLYGGLAVLPRWNELPGYEHLGVAPASLVRDPEALARPSRSSYTVGGAGFGWRSARTRARVSFQEQHEPGGLARRDLSLEAQHQVFDTVAAGGSAILAIESEHVSDARLWLDAGLARVLDVSAEYLRVEPALLLSSQSVLSVFSTDAYDELGGHATLRASDRFSFDAGSFVEIYGDTRPGTRSEVGLRVLADKSRRTFVRVSYARVIAPRNGYHSVRSSVSRRLLAPVVATLDGFVYFYDRPILRYRSSAIVSGTLSFETSDALRVLWGASLARSPYARFDAQTQVRLAYDFDFSSERRQQ